MNAAVAQERWQGQVINGKYPLLEWIGGSASTAVFRTEFPGKPAPTVAIKLVRADSLLNPAQQVLRWKEYAQLSDPALLQMFDSGACQITGAQWIYCVLEYAEEHLDQVLPARPLSAAEVSELLPPVLDGLSFLHARGMVHSRLKPSNILAIRNRLKLSVDNIRSFSQGAKIHPIGPYDAPEAESGKLSPAADLWSLGMTLVAAFDQRPLIWNRSNPAMPAIPRSIPTSYRLIVRECLRVHPEERCSVERIKELLHPQARPSKPSSQARRRKVLAPVLAVVALSAVIFGLIFFRHTSKTQTAPAAVAEVQPSSEGTAPEPAPTIPNAPAQSGSLPVATKGAVLERVLPAVPLSARLTIHGKVRVRVRVAVDQSGRVSLATLTVPGPSRYFARLALEASQKWRFTPAQPGGRPAETEWLLQYKFGRSSTEVDPIEVH
jgi:TonB family protein